MAIILRLIVHKGKIIYDNIYVIQDSIPEYEREDRHEKRSLEIVQTCNNLIQPQKSKPVFLRKQGFNAYLIAAYVSYLKTFEAYRRAAVSEIFRFLRSSGYNEPGIPTVLLKLSFPKKQYLDYTWNDRITLMIIERQEVEHAMSWLSTLGGAFSALGETFQHCAQMAGKISLKQFELALRLGDPLLLARCKLYAALSLMQQGDLKTPKSIIRKTYTYALEQKDTRLQNMCKGLWAKLKYYWKQQIKQQRHLSVE